jgi:MFS family permease
MADPRAARDTKADWFTPGVRGIGAASLLSDLGHEVPTSLLPSLLTTTLGAPASALGIIEGVADACAGIARFTGGALADDPGRRRTVAIGGYASTAVLSSLIGVATSVWQVGALRASAWASRGLRVPARNALLADVVSPEAFGRAYGFERFMDNLGAVGGPLLALLLVAAFGVRAAILLSVIPGSLAAFAIVYAIRQTRQPTTRTRQPIRLRVRPLLRGDLGRLLGAAAAFEFGNVAATFFILRATGLLMAGHGANAAVELALVLYVAYNATATVVSLPAGHFGDRRGHVVVFGVGAACFLVAFVAFALVNTDGIVLAVAFIAAGAGIGFAETGQNAAVAGLAPSDLRGSSFGLLAAIQSVGNLAASAVAGILWSTFSPTAAFLYLAGWMVLALGLLGTVAGGGG